MWHLDHEIERHFRQLRIDQGLEDLDDRDDGDVVAPQTRNALVDRIRR